MDSLYNVNVLRQVPFLIINRLESVFNLIDSLSALPSVVNSQEFSFHSTFAVEAKKEDVTLDSMGLLQTNKEGSGQYKFLFRVDPCYGGNFYSEERLLEIEKASDTRYNLLEVNSFKVYLKLENFRTHEVDTNWGVNFDIVLKVEENGNIIFSENCQSSFWKDNLYDTLVEHYEDGQYDSIIVVDSVLTSESGQIFQAKCTLDIDKGELLLNEFPKDIDSCYVVSHGYRFDLEIANNGEILSNLDKLEKWQSSYRKVLSINEVIDKNEDFILNKVNDTVVISGIDIDSSILSEQYEILEVKLELESLEKMKFKRSKLDSLSDIIQLKEELEECESPFILFDKKDKKFLLDNVWAKAHSNLILETALKEQIKLLF